ncbi:unnamed protein product [Caenorhabditis bovis]|uniref:Sister chromatid cohesion protein DCC1 n=1 Tax=Caenorhabditis bovis TaxID=2654633 RepID=A0A8S1FBN7_9PELO|nr:unnamed protein product [Caenorhabditis bovis]
MNKFLANRATPAPKSNSKEPKEATSNKENASEIEKDDPKSSTEILHEAISEKNAKLAYNILSKNRPFDLAMNKQMTSIVFENGFSSSASEHMLLSVDEAVVSALTAGESITIRGENDDDAVLCTENATFPIKIVESATTYLIMHDVLGPPEKNASAEPEFQVRKISGKCYGIGELCPPSDILKLARLKDLLHENEIVWETCTQANEQFLGYSLNDLLKSVQMSIGEVETALADLPVVKLKKTGKLRYLSHKYRVELLKRLVDGIDDDDQHEISMEKVTKSSLRDYLPPNALDEIIDWFVETRCDQIDESHFRINEEKLARDIIIGVLYSTRKMSFAQFEDSAKKCLPFGIEIKDSYFAGICDIVDSPSGRLIFYLAPEDLPDETRDRMIYLFNHRRLWTMEQIRPFFNDIFKSKVAFDKYLVQKCDYTISNTNEMLYCGVRA